MFGEAVRVRFCCSIAFRYDNTPRVSHMLSDPECLFFSRDFIWYLVT